MTGSQEGRNEDQAKATLPSVRRPEEKKKDALSYAKASEVSSVSHCHRGNVPLPDNSAIDAVSHRSYIHLKILCILLWPCIGCLGL